MTLTRKAIAGYRVLQKIGVGAASELFAVQDPKTKQVWALKHVVKHSDKDDRFLEQVLQEYTVGSRLSHPNVRAMHKLIKHRKMFKMTSVSLIMELVDGTSLDQKLPRNDLQAVKIFKQIAQGLAHMHGPSRNPVLPAPAYRCRCVYRRLSSGSWRRAVCPRGSPCSMISSGDDAATGQSLL